MRFRVLTWNIHKCIGGIDRRYRPERVIEVMRHHGPDVALLQEVDEGARRSKFHRQVDMIGDALGLGHRYYCRTHKLRSQGHYGNALISRWPLLDVDHVDLTIGTRKKRGVIFGRVHLSKNGRTETVIFYNMHLGLAGSERHEQLRRFIAHEIFTAFDEDTPMVLGGDLNDLWGTLGPALLVPSGFRRAGDLRRTFPAAMPVRPLDAIFVRGGATALECGVSDHAAARVASDHLPLVAQVEIPGELIDETQ